MNEAFPERSETVKREHGTPAVSRLLRDGALLEMVYRPSEHRTVFCIFENGRWRYESSLVVGSERLVPYSPNNNLLKNEVVLFASEPEEFGSEDALVSEIQAFIHRYVDVSSLFEKIASYYVLLSWVYDAFSELPYLRLRGDPGSGKTRFLLIVGSLCYKPIFASGASTVSPLFRILDGVRGTLIIDEGDFRFSDERAEIVKILNNGNAKGFPVLRSEAVGKEFSPRAYTVFGPKLVATRGFFQDRALESRCLTEEMGESRLRSDIPINLPPTVKDEALRLRNKLLLFRFKSLRNRTVSEALVDRSIEPRLNQIFVPLLSVIDDSATRADLRNLARTYNRELIDERGMDTEAQVLEVIRDLIATGQDASVKEMARWFADRHADEYRVEITPRWIGGVIRKKLHLKPQKSHGTYLLPGPEISKLDRLYEKYGLTTRAGVLPTEPLSPDRHLRSTG